MAPNIKTPRYQPLPANGLKPAAVTFGVKQKAAKPGVPVQKNVAKEARGEAAPAAKKKAQLSQPDQMRNAMANEKRTVKTYGVAGTTGKQTNQQVQRYTPSVVASPLKKNK